MRPAKALVALALAGVASAAAAAPAAAADSPCPNEAIRVQQRATWLPDCRAFELVSPADKGGQAVDVGANAGLTRASVDGNAFAYVSWGNFADAVGGMSTSYRARRGSNGWSSEAVSPATVHPFPYAGTNNSAWWQASADLEVGFTMTRDWFDPTDLGTYPQGNTDIYRVGPGQFTELISRGNGSERTVPPLEAQFEGELGTRFVSDDGRHVLFRTQARLVPEDADRAAGATDTYVRVDGATHLVALDSDENLINKCGSSHTNTLAPELADRAISSDGSRVIFQTPQSNGPAGEPDCAKPKQVYMRINNDETVHVSRSRRTDCATQDPCTGTPDPAPLTNSDYLGASTDGRYVFIRGANLTDDATGSNVYRYDVETDTLEVFQTNTSIFGGMARVSGDGSTAYYISQFAYTPDAALGQRNLYARRGDEVKLIASASGAVLETQLAKIGAQTVVSPDGRFFAFTTTVVLGAFDHTGRRALYLYDFDLDELTCVSCDPAGQRPVESAVVSDATLAGHFDLNPALSADGETLVFESRDRLIGQDTNSVRDVYAYSISDGRLSLISSGRGGSGGRLLGMTPDGTGVFFATGDELVRGDDDGNLDVYVARVNGGFPVSEQAEPEAPCEGDGCQGASAGRPSAPGIASRDLVSRGNVAPSPARARLSVTSAVSGGAVGRLRVRVSGRGRIVVSGRSVRRVRRAAGRAAVYRVPVALSRRARAQLRRRGVVSTRVRVRFEPVGAPAVTRSVRLVFRIDSKNKGNGRKSSRRASSAAPVAREGR